MNTENVTSASIEIAQLHGHQVDRASVGEPPISYVDTEQNDWGLYVPDENYLETVAETVSLLESAGVDVHTFITVDDTYPQKAHLDFPYNSLNDVLEPIVDQYINTLTYHAAGIEKETVPDPEDAVEPDTWVWESRVGEKTLEELLEHDEIPELDDPGLLGSPETWGIVWSSDGKEAKIHSKNQNAGPGIKAKIANKHPPHEYKEQTKIYDFTCPTSHVGYALEMTGQTDNTGIPEGDLAISFTQNWNHFDSGGYGPSMSDKSEYIMNILEGSGGKQDKSGPYDFSAHFTFDAPYISRPDVVESVFDE